MRSTVSTLLYVGTGIVALVLINWIGHHGVAVHTEDGWELAGRSWWMLTEAWPLWLAPSLMATTIAWWGTKSAAMTIIRTDYASARREAEQAKTQAESRERAAREREQAVERREHALADREQTLKEQQEAATKAVEEAEDDARRARRLADNERRRRKDAVAASRRRQGKKARSTG